MSFEKISSGLSRILNGNFASGTAYWGGSDITHIRYGQAPLDLAGDPYFNRPPAPLSSGAPPPAPEKPMYALEADGDFWHDVQYNDLAIYPSTAIIKAVRVLPSGYGEVLLVAPFKVDENAFAMDDSGNLITVEMGDTVVVTASSDPRAGEFRAGDVLSKTRMMASIVSGQPNNAFDSGEYQVALSYKTGSPLSQVRVLADLTTAERADGLGVGLLAGDCIVSKFPKAAAKILGWTYDGTYTILSIGPETGLREFPDTGGTWNPLQDWFIASSFTADVRRRLPVCLYDLTLAYSVKTPTGFDPDDVKVQFLDEFGNLIDAFEPFYTNQYDVPSDLFPARRFIQRFVVEARDPYFGSTRILFGNSGTTVVFDVVLFRGDYVEKVKIDDDFSLHQSRVDALEGLIPKSTVIAYVGGSVCPPGFTPYRGIGYAATRLDHGPSLVTEFGECKDWLADAELITLEDGQVRTQVTIDESLDRSVPGRYPYQEIGRFVDVVPFRYPEGSPYKEQHEEGRALVGDPLPMWVTESGLVKTDILPGFVIEFMFPYGSEFALISQFSQGDLVVGLEEQEPPNPYFAIWFFFLYWVRELSPQTKNEMLQKEGYYGEFKPVTVKSRIMELVGDVLWMAKRARDENVVARVWKSGVVAHAEKLNDMKTHPLHTVDGFGGYGYFGIPHTHRFQVGDGIIVPDVGNSDGDVITLKLPVEHAHQPPFGAVTVPKVKPVLLCQKM